MVGCGRARGNVSVHVSVYTYISSVPGMYYLYMKVSSKHFILLYFFFFFFICCQFSKQFPSAGHHVMLYRPHPVCPHMHNLFLRIFHMNKNNIRITV